PADAPAGIGAVEDRQMLGLEMRRAFERHGATAIGVGLLDLLLREAERRQHVERHLVQLLVREAQALGAELLAERPLVEGEADVEGGGEILLELLQRALGEAARPELAMIDAGRAVERAVADGIADDIFDLLFAVAE